MGRSGKGKGTAQETQNGGVVVLHFGKRLKGCDELKERKTYQIKRKENLNSRFKSELAELDIRVKATDGMLTFFL